MTQYQRILNWFDQVGIYYATLENRHSLEVKYDFLGFTHKLYFNIGSGKLKGIGINWIWG